MEKRIISVTGKDYTPRFFSLEHLLVVISKIYESGARFRIRMYKIGVLKPKKLPCPVIAVGNITAGGSGKTPMAIYLAETLIARGYRPVVVSRGYRGRLGRRSAIVGDGKKVFRDATISGDEPFMMAQRKRFPVVVGKNRYKAGLMALDNLDVDVVILDDGFQHMGLARNLDLVLLDYDRPIGNGRILPAGRLRETPTMARDRIHALILTRSPDFSADMKDSKKGPGFISSAFLGIPFFCTRHLPYLSQVYPGRITKFIPKALADLQNKKAVLFSGIAKNKSFNETVTCLGVNVLAHLEFQDHYRYKESDFKDIQTCATGMAADIILTTEKDWSKVAPTFVWEIAIGIVGIRIEFENPDAFADFIEFGCMDD